MTKSMKQIRQAKHQRMKKILEAINEQPREFREIEKLIYSDKSNITTQRTIQNYLDELRGLELIEYNKEEKLYYPAGARKQIFNSKLEYNMALKHSKQLFLSTTNEQLFDLMDPYLTLHELTYNQKRYPKQISHLKMGYFQEIWSLIQKYLKIMEETGLSNIPDYPKIMRMGVLGIEEAEASMPERYPKADEGYICITRLTRLPALTHEPTKDYCKKHGIPWQIQKETIKEIEALQELIIGRLYSIIGDIKLGIPLRGYCESCPHRKVIIKRKK